MQWIGIGFLIAIGFGLACIAIPLAIALLEMGWEMRRVVVAIVIVIILIGLAIAYPQAIGATLLFVFVLYLVRNLVFCIARGVRKYKLERFWLYLQTLSLVIIIAAITICFAALGILFFPYSKQKTSGPVVESTDMQKVQTDAKEEPTHDSNFAIRETISEKTYFVVLASGKDRLGARRLANEHRARTVETSRYQNLTPGFFAVVYGPFYKEEAEKELLGLDKTRFPSAYVKNSGGFSTSVSAQEYVIMNFYFSLENADGVRALASITPAKRETGNFTREGIGTFYSNLQEPFLLVDLAKTETSNIYEVMYSYKKVGLPVCFGTATVTLEQMQGSWFIRKIVAKEKCDQLAKDQKTASSQPSMITSSEASSTAESFNFYNRGYSGGGYTGGYYRGYGDGSGHDAGYEWAEENDIDDEYDCDGNSNSFNEGCMEYVEERQEEMKENGYDEYGY